MGMELEAKHFNLIKGLVIEGDSKMAISKIERILNGSFIGKSEEQVAIILKNAPRIVLSHVDRSTNEVADHIAKLACLNSFVWDRGMPLPPDLFNCFYHDSIM